MRIDSFFLKTLPMPTLRKVGSPKPRAVSHLISIEKEIAKSQKFHSNSQKLKAKFYFQGQKL